MDRFFKFQVCPDFTGLALELENCFTAFVALAFGMVVGFFLFILECCSSLCKLKLSLLEAYDRGDDDLEDINPEDIQRIVQIKDSIITELEEQAKFSNLIKAMLVNWFYFKKP